MVAKAFISVLVVLVLFNAVFYIAGYNDDLLSFSSIIGIFLSLGVIAVVVSIIPTTSAGSTISWFLQTIMILSILYSISFSVLTYNLTIGVGLVTKLTNMFSGSVNDLSFIPYLFFHLLGIIGLLAGLLGAKEG